MKKKKQNTPTHTQTHVFEYFQAIKTYIIIIMTNKKTTTTNDH